MIFERSQMGVITMMCCAAALYRSMIINICFVKMIKNYNLIKTG